MIEITPIVQEITLTVDENTSVINIDVVETTTPVNIEVYDTINSANNYAFKNDDYSIFKTDSFIEVTEPSNITLPSAIGILGKRFSIINTSIGNVIVNTTLSQTIGNKQTNNPSSITLAPEEWLDVISNGSNYIMI